VSRPPSRKARPGHSLQHCQSALEQSIRPLLVIHMVGAPITPALPIASFNFGFLMKALRLGDTGENHGSR